MKNGTKQTFRVYWQHIRRYRLAFFCLIILAVAGALCSTIIPIFLKKIVDAISAPGAREALYGAAVAFLFVAGGLELLRWALNRSMSFWYINFLSRLMANVNCASFDHLHRHSFSFFASNFSGSLVKKVNYLTRSFEDVLDNFFWNLIPMIVNTSVIVSVLFWRNSRMGWAISAWLAVFFVANFFFANWKYKYNVIANEAISKTTGFLADTIANFSALKLFNGYKREVKSFVALNDEVRRKNLFTWSMDEVFNSLSSLLMIVLEVGLLWLAVILWRQGSFTSGDFVLVQSYVIIIIGQSWMFNRMLRNFYRSFSDAAEMTELLHLSLEVVDAPRAKALKVKKGEIEFAKVVFCYHETRKILEDFNLKIAAGEKVALIGPSGAGKTTVVKSLLRNFDLTGGHILIDGQDIAGVTQESLWQSISLVPQDPVLFHRTLKENIRYGRPEATDEEVIRASKAAHCHEFISGLPEKYETHVGERGIKLSGGERQRVAIARAILRDAPILVLDEATSSLDSESETLIQDALEKLMKGKTVIVIAHRLSTIRKMDRIIFIEDGKIKEEGTHEALENKTDGLYRRLWEIQAGGFLK